MTIGVWYESARRCVSARRWYSAARRYWYRSACADSVEGQRVDDEQSDAARRTGNGPYAPFGFESIEKQLWRNKQNDRPISDSEIKAVQSQLFKTNQWLPPAGHVSEDVTSHA
ncbi:hypothetical protein AVEN_51712-1 [Araneus ventricosus]|uniref:Uncharacterized protein n=1 Tax=Araneus ventricosus TaxID=182803 RepID=A0A4Y2GJQ6_ARAVE|nr:hypothetical protein AVEN_51712-1 [Araneus ventricosus]